VQRTRNGAIENSKDDVDDECVVDLDLDNDGENCLRRL